MSELRVRKSIRLKNYDYSSKGYYFVTICVKDKHELLGTIRVGAITNRPFNKITNRPPVELTEYGKISDKAIRSIATHHRNVKVDKYVIMPNHIHMILVLNDVDDCGRLLIAPTNLSKIVQQLKGYISKAIGFSIWQKSYHDHIIRDAEDYRRIWKYIDENPCKWQEDEYYA